jgi:hypothetical protein
LFVIWKALGKKMPDQKLINSIDFEMNLSVFVTDLFYVIMKNKVFKTLKSRTFSCKEAHLSAEILIYFSKFA